MSDSNLSQAMLNQIAQSKQSVESRVGTNTETGGTKREVDAALTAALGPVPMEDNKSQAGLAARLARKRQKKLDQQAVQATNQQLAAAAAVPKPTREAEQKKWMNQRKSINLESSTKLNQATILETLKLLKQMPVLFCPDIDLFREPTTDEEKAQFASNEAKLKRADIVAAVSGQTAEIDAIIEAGKEYTPHLQRVMDLKNALINKSELDDAKTMRELIEEAESQDRKDELAARDRHRFIEAYKLEHNGNVPPASEIPKPTCPYGDIILGPSMTMAPPRFGKSWPAIGFAFLCRFLECDIMWAVAPNKTVVMNEMLKKLRLSGAEEAGLIKLAHTLDAKKGPEAERIAKDKETNFFVWASDEHLDAEIYATRCEYLKSQERMIVHIFDEADTLIKPEKALKETTLDIIMRFFPTSWGYRMMIGATMLPLLHEPQLWGTLLDEVADPDDALSPYFPLGALRPILGKNGKKYTSMQDTVDVAYDGKKFTREAVIERAKFIAKTQCGYRIQDMQRIVAEAQDPARKDDATATNHPLNKAFNNLSMQEIRQNVDNDIALKQSQLADLQALCLRMDNNEFGPRDPTRANSKPIVRDSDADEPYLRKGLVPWGNDPIATAKIELYFETLLSRDACVQATQSHWLNQMIVATITQQVKDSKIKRTGKEISGYDGQMAFWSARFCQLAEALKVNLALLVYSTQLTKKTIQSNCFGFDVADSFKAKNPVKLFEVRAESNPDGTVITNRLPVTSWEDSDDAFAYLHDFSQSKLTNNKLLRTHTVVLGYDMLKAATTIANERSLFIHKPDGTAEAGGMLYSPKYIMFAHNDERQLNALLQMFGRALNQVRKEFVIDGYLVHALTHKETLDMLRVYATGEMLLAEFFCSVNATDDPYCKVISGLKKFFMEQKAWHGDITEQFLGLRRIKVKTQFEGVSELGADEIDLLIKNRPEDAYGENAAFEDSDDEASQPQYDEHGKELPSHQGRKGNGKAKARSSAGGDDEEEEDEDEDGVDMFKKCQIAVGSMISARGAKPYSSIKKDVWQELFNEMPKSVHKNYVPHFKGNPNGKQNPAWNSKTCLRQMQAAANAINLVSQHATAYPMGFPEFGNVTADDPKKLMLAISKYHSRFYTWATTLPDKFKPADSSAEQMHQVIRNLARNYFKFTAAELNETSHGAGSSS